MDRRKGCEFGWFMAIHCTPFGVFHWRWNKIDTLGNVEIWVKEDFPWEVSRFETRGETTKDENRSKALKAGKLKTLDWYFADCFDSKSSMFSPFVAAGNAFLWSLQQNRLNVLCDHHSGLSSKRAAICQFVYVVENILLDLTTWGQSCQMCVESE